MCLKIILKVTKNQGFTLFLEDAIFEKPQRMGEGGGQIDPLPPPSPAVLGLIKCEINLILTCSESCVIEKQNLQ